MFSSDNASALASLQEVISKQATEQKTKISITHSIMDDSFAAVMKKLYPKLEYQADLSKKVQIIDALKEIQLQEENLDFLQEDLRAIVTNGKALEHELSLQPLKLEFMYRTLFCTYCVILFPTGLISKLFEDRCRFKAQSPSLATELNQVLHSKNFSLKQLLEYFK